MKRSQAITLLAFTLVAGCMHARPAHVSESMLTCAEATRVGRDTVMRLGYTIKEMSAATASQPGKVVGTRETGWGAATPEAGEIRTITVVITCSDAGSTFDAVTDEGATTQLSFPTQFASALKEKLTVAPRRSLPPLEEASGLILKIEPQRSAAALQEFGQDLPAAGITPVKVAITNKSTRRYRLQREDVRLLTEQGTRAEPLSVAAVTERLSKSPAAASATTSLSEKLIRNDEIAPGTSLTGYLYFTAAAYQRARVELMDVESEESEGFSVEF